MDEYRKRTGTAPDHNPDTAPPTREWHPYSRAEQRLRRRRQRRRRRLAAFGLLAVFVLTGLLVFHLSRSGEEESSTDLPGSNVVLSEAVQEAFLPVNQWSRPGDALTEINGIVIHYVGNPNTTAQANRNYFASLASGEDGTYASSHFVVGLDGEIIQCIPLTEIAYASNTRNDDTIAIEVCHPDETGEFSTVTYNAVVALTADLCRQLKLDPMEDVIRHYDVTGKECPLYYVEHPEAWQQFLADVQAAK